MNMKVDNNKDKLDYLIKNIFINSMNTETFNTIKLNNNID